MIRIAARSETWPIDGTFRIARGAKHEAVVIVAEANADGIAGRGEAVPYARYGETVDGVLAAIAALGPIAGRAALHALLPAGAARNAVDCALIDLEARRTGSSAASLFGLAEPGPITTCYTLIFDTPEAMAAKALAKPRLPLLKLKLGGAGDAERMAAVRAARPDARLIADANEAWSEDELVPLLEAAHRSGLELVEQPLPADRDDALVDRPRGVPVCADESAHTSADLPALRNRYDAVNIKLDKAGGLTEAVRMAEAARRLGFDLMVGCMVATSLSMAPALLLAGSARWVDLDGPLLLARDRPRGLSYADGIIQPPAQGFWG